MTSELKTVKSALHDATPSWNGFNYQGKVGLYVCLCMIKAEYLEAKSTEAIDQEYFDKFSLEYEWVEDFSILKDGEYLSIHQVKHYNAVGFSGYLDALNTIICRKLGIISISDLSPYVICKDKEDPSIAARVLLKALQQAEVIDFDCQIIKGWREKIKCLEVDSQVPATRALAAILDLHAKAYGRDLPVYVHTVAKIPPPSKAIHTYSWPHPISGKVLGDKTLREMNIHIDDDPVFPFTLALDDETLELNLIELIVDLRNIIKPESLPVNGTAANCHLAALLLEIDRHIADRHQKITAKEKAVTTPLATESVLKFSKLIHLIEKDFYVQDDEHFALCGKLVFEQAISTKIMELRYAIEDLERESLDSNEAIKAKARLEQYRHNVFSKMSNADLLRYLEQSSPHHKNTGPRSIYFAKIAQPDAITNTLLSFICLLRQDLNNFFVKCTADEKYLPSCIDVSNHPSPAELAHRRVAKSIADASAENAFINCLLYNYNFITIKAKDNCEIPCPIEPPSFSSVTSPADEKRPIFHDKKRTQLIHYAAAAKIINN